jgi:hypothetical protein
MGYPVKQRPPTESATITVAFLNERKEGQFSASIKDTDKNLYWVSGKYLDHFKVGERYEIEFSVSQSKNGFINRRIEEDNFGPSIRHLTPQAQQPKDTSESSEDRAAAKVADAVKQVTPAPQIRANYNNNPGAAVMGMVNQYIGRGDVPLHSDDIARAINECLAGYLKSKLGE